MIVNIRNFIRYPFVVGCFLFVLFFASGVSAARDSGSAAFTPWSGHWWPFKAGGLATGNDYRGHPAPLEKYYLLTTGLSTGQAIDWYLNRYYDENAESSWGLCPAYARSAVKETYHIYPSSEDNIIFRVGDKKGLLTLCHDDRQGVIYGSEGTPQEFHYWLLHYIGDQKTAFAADLSTDDGVWYYPVYAYEMESTRTGTGERVTVSISYATHMQPDFMGTETRKRYYTYLLGIDAVGNVVSGEWTGSSVTNHPRTISYPETTGSLNPYLDVQKIREIAHSRDDSLEMPENASSRLLPGSYNLVLLNEDVYILEGASGDVAMLDILLQEGSREAVSMEISDGSNVLIHQETITQKDPTAHFRLILEDLPLTIRIFQNNYLLDPNIYTLNVDFEGAHVRSIPYIPTNGPWSGFAITNSSDQQPVEIMLVTADTSGKPLQTILGPLDLAPGQKYLTHFSSLPVRKHELADTDSLKIISNHPVEMVNLFADTGGPMAGFCGTASVGSRLIIPDVFDNEPWDSQSMKGSALNLSLTDTDITCDVYSTEGKLARSISQNIAARRIFSIQPGSSLFSGLPDGGWMDIYADEPGAELMGYQYIQDDGNGANIFETLFALPVTSDILYVQHVTPETGPWQTDLILINPNPENNEVRIHAARAEGDHSTDIRINLNPFEKQVIDISSDFGNIGNRSLLEISGDFSLSGYVAYMAEKGDAGFYPLLNEADFKTELIMPHASYNNGRWYTGVGVCNPNDYWVSVSIIPYDQNGQALMPLGIDLPLDPGAYEVFTVHKMFPALADDISFLKIHAMEPSAASIGGFYLYGNAGGQNLEPRKLVSGGNM